jgi:hypothetical protein
MRAIWKYRRLLYFHVSLSDGGGLVYISRFVLRPQRFREACGSRVG